MRRAARQDSNHAHVATEFLRCGCSVHNTAGLGGGFPDLIVAAKPRTGGSVTFVVEIKDGDKPPSARRLTDKEQTFAATWKGLRYVVERASDVPDVVMDACRGGS